MGKTIEVIPGSGGQQVYAYTGKFAPYSTALTIGEIIKGLPDPQTARMCLTDIMAALAEHESKTENPANGFVQYLAAGIAGKLNEMGLDINAAATVALNIYVTPKMPAQSLEITVEYDETKL